MGQIILISATVFVSLLLIGIVLIQKSKGGGLASNFAGANQVLGVRRANNSVEKATWTLAIIICVLSLISGIILVNSNEEGIHAKAKAPAQEQAVEFPTATTPAAELPAVATEEETVVVEETAAPAANAEAAQ